MLLLLCSLRHIKVMAQQASAPFCTNNRAINVIIAAWCRNKKTSNEKAKKLPDRQPCNHEDAILATAEW
jgi:hypothetical protein